MFVIDLKLEVKDLTV